MASCVVTGAGGFIGGHLVADLVAHGTDVRAVDAKPVDRWYQLSPEAENVTLDLSQWDQSRQAVAGADRIYNLAADMGGIGFIEGNKAQCMLSVLINTHLLLAARDAGVRRYFYASSACVYAAGKQDRPDVDALAEADAYPAMPEDGYVDDPLNLGSSQMVTINQLVDLVEAVAGTRLRRSYVPDAPQGVRGRSSDNATIRARLGWEPTTPLAEGIEATYRWIHDDMRAPAPTGGRRHNGYGRNSQVRGRAKVAGTT